MNLQFKYLNRLNWTRLDSTIDVLVVLILSHSLKVLIWEFAVKLSTTNQPTKVLERKNGLVDSNNVALRCRQVCNGSLVQHFQYNAMIYKTRPIDQCNGQPLRLSKCRWVILKWNQSNYHYQTNHYRIEPPRITWKGCFWIELTSYTNCNQWVSEWANDSYNNDGQVKF